MNLAVIGLGKLGLPLAAVLAAQGHRVLGVDTDTDRVAALRTGSLRTGEPGVEQLLAAHGDRLDFRADLAPAIAASEMAFLVLPTPSEADGSFTHRFLNEELVEVGAALRRCSASEYTVVVASTVMPGATDAELRPALERGYGGALGSIGLCYSPLFIALGSVVRDLQDPDLVLIGEPDARTGDALAELHRRWHPEVPLQRMRTVNAELAKLALNTFLTTKITYANMLAEVCEGLPGADVDVVTAALGLDGRVSPRFLKGGLGYGGPCFPRDNRAFEATARSAGARADLAAATDALNEHYVSRVTDLVARYAQPPAPVGVLGLSYRAGTEHTDASPGVALANTLRRAGYSIVLHDPMGSALLRAKVGEDFVTCAALGDLLEQVGILVIATDAVEFRALEGLLGEAGAPAVTVIDCWRMLAPGRIGRRSRVVGLGIGGLDVGSGKVQE